MGNHTEDVASTLSSFCGPPVAGDDGSFLRSDCRTGALAAGVHCAFAVAVVPCIVYLRHRYRNKSWLRLRCHNLRWLVTTALLMLALGWIAEAILTDCASSSAAAARPYAHVLSTSLLVAVTCSIIYYHTIEIRNLPLLLVLLLCYWTLGIVAHGVRVASLYSRLANGAAVGGPRLFLDSSVFILFVVLLLIECYLFLQARVSRVAATESHYLTILYLYSL
ncbi:PREDICTED: ATP-binding cassette sub-family C member 8-like [Priapulus caudatus]|uniref:ATP-binding cassette sub-family C member 8-like n=1 Tax=Priapulus caudatus TaxID=37621 RepID=A0ABM1EPW6_PRICU|nr:PREDICTED: ATP-binding cassette sub-family C member 8-like [Priapulus caudatus]